MRCVARVVLCVAHGTRCVVLWRDLSDFVMCVACIVLWRDALWCVVLCGDVTRRVVMWRLVVWCVVLCYDT